MAAVIAGAVEPVGRPFVVVPGRQLAAVLVLAYPVVLLLLLQVFGLVSFAAVVRAAAATAELGTGTARSAEQSATENAPFFFSF